MSIKVYVEGGGDSNQLRRQCRNGFREFFEKAGLKGRMPRVVACGSRQRAYDRFCAAIDEAEADSFIVLLVDSEAAVAASDSPWEHLRKRDNWTQPSAAADDSTQLMVQCMEAWFVADRQSSPNLSRPRQPIDESRWRLNHYAAIERFVFKAAHLVADEGEYAGGLWSKGQRKGQIGHGHLM